MGIIRGLKKIHQHVEEQEARQSGSDRAPTKWFKINDKQSVNVVFLQEMDEDSPNFSKKNDLGFLAVEHANPDNFKRKALCTMEEEGACWAHEQHRLDYKAGWGPKTRLYINVLVDEGNGTEPYVAVLSQGQSAKQITPTLIEYSGDDETITDKWFSIKRTGAGFNDTSYTLRAKKEHGLNVEDYELFDLNEVVRQVPYAEQEAHYRNGEESAAPTAPDTAISVGAGSATSADNEW